MPVAWVVSPIVWRVPVSVAWTPEEREHIWSVNKYRFNDVVGSVDKWITYNLNGVTC